MKARMDNIVAIFPGTLKALRDLSTSAKEGGVPARTIMLVTLRASQINGCGVCVGIHSHELKSAGETDDRLFSVAAWRDTPYFTDAERAALALTEAATRISDKVDPVTDEIWEEAAKYYDEKALAQLIVTISAINVWNRFNVATRQVAFGALELTAD